MRNTLQGQDIILQRYRKQLNQTSNNLKFTCLRLFQQKNKTKTKTVIFLKIETLEQFWKTYF